MIIQAVIFDFDGPINDSFREGLRRIKTLCAIHDIRFTRKERSKLADLWGIPGVELLQQGLDISPELAAAAYKEWERLDLRDPVPLVPGAKDVLFWLRQNGFASALLTTRNRENIMEIFERLDLVREFKVISTKQDVSHRKPDPRAFDFVLEKLQENCGISKKQCVFVGDTPADIEAGKGVDIETLVVQTGPYLLKHAIEHPIKLENILRSIDDLPEWMMEHHEGEILHDYK